MADIDIDPFGEHESRPEEPTDEHIPLDPVIPGRSSTWEPDRGEQETSFGGESQRTKLMKDYVRDLYKKISENISETPEECHYDYFKLENGELYYRGKRKPLTTKGVLKSVGMLADILGKGGLRSLGFDIPRVKVTSWQAVMLDKAAEELPSESDIAKAYDIELQEIVEKVSGIVSQIKDIQTDTEDLFEHPLRELLGLDKQLRSIRGSLKVEVAKKVELEEHIAKEQRKLKEFREYPGVYDDAMREDITKRIDALNDELATRQEPIDLLKGRLKNQITSFKETIAKVLDKDTSLGEKIRTLFREQGITIASILMAIGMAIGVLIEAFLPGSAATASGGGGEPPPKDEKGLKGWIRNKRKALASLSGRLGMKAAEALPGTIGGIISWILNRAKDVVGWVLQNLWALVVGVGGLTYTYMVIRK